MLASEYRLVAGCWAAGDELAPAGPEGAFAAGFSDVLGLFVASLVLFEFCKDSCAAAAVPSGLIVPLRVPISVPLGPCTVGSSNIRRSSPLGISFSGRKSISVCWKRSLFARRSIQAW